MSDTVLCSRCGLENERIASDLPLPDDLQRQVLAKVCARCWRDWQDMEVKVINELHLNFMDPAAQTTLNERMRVFFETPPDEFRAGPDVPESEAPEPPS